MNLLTILDDRVRDDSGRVAIVDARGRRTTFGELEREVSALAAALFSRGLRTADTVVVLVPVSRELYVVLLALLRLGAVAVFVEPALGARELARSCERAEPAAFIGVWRAHLLRALSPTLRDVPLAVLAGRGFVPGAVRLSALVRGEDAFATTPLDDDAPALLTYSSGTTGAPKVISRSHGLLRRQHDVLTAAFPIRASDRGLSMAPLFALSDLAAGAAVVLPPRALASAAPAACAAIAARGVTVLRANPRSADAIARSCEASGLTLPAVRAAFIGGAAVEAQVVARLAAVMPNAVIHAVYGSSEAEPISALASDDILGETDALTMLGRGHCVGRPVAPTRVRIDAGDEESLFPSPAPDPPPRVGEIVVSGPHVNTRTWHRTGDTGYIDETGRIWLLGREADRVRRAGRVLHGYAIEPLVERLTTVERCALVGIADARLGERAVLVVTARPGADHAVVRRDVGRLCAERDVPVDEVRVARTMPLDARHRSKIRRHELRRALSPAP